ncbi:MAG TPA: hypothetical protein VK589_18825 [Chryseolinea sp.]|nr:hypothetical protein [Chryseolinea sp.]
MAIVLLFFLGKANAQDVLVRGGFFKDSLRVGDQTGYYLAAEYPTKLNVLFPDSSFGFAPFEYESKKYFPTKTTQGRSYDSVVYYLSTFEIDRIQSLSLPVFQVNPMDCTAYLTMRDTILLSELVKDLPDTVTLKNLPLKVNIAYEDVPYTFNYLIAGIVAGVLLVVAAITWIVFGKRIRKHFRLKRMQKAHQKFMETFNLQLDSVKSAFSSVTAENALSHWKKYMEQLEARPYTKLTTKETLQMEKNESLGRNLHAIDGAIYGHDTAVIESLESIRNFADKRFVQKLEELKHG